MTVTGPSVEGRCDDINVECRVNVVSIFNMPICVFKLTNSAFESPISFSFSESNVGSELAA